MAAGRKRARGRVSSDTGDSSYGSKCHSEGSVKKEVTWPTVSSQCWQVPTLRRGLSCGHGRRAEEQPQVVPNAQWQRYLFRRDRQGVHRKSHAHQGRSRY